MSARVEEPTYGGMHTRLARIRGSASRRSCVECGAPADRWSYNRSGVDERQGSKNGRSVVYSINLMQYEPCCVTCANRRDSKPHENCKQGHALTPDNIREWNGNRSCKTCGKARDAARYQRNRERHAEHHRQQG